MVSQYIECFLFLFFFLFSLSPPPPLPPFFSFFFLFFSPRLYFSFILFSLSLLTGMATAIDVMSMASIMFISCMKPYIALAWRRDTMERRPGSLGGAGGGASRRTMFSTQP